MARFNEILHGRHNRALQKLSGIKGEVPSPQLASEIMPVWPMFYGVENRSMESWDRYAFFGGPGAVAAQFGFARFRNPKGSNFLAVIEKATIFSGTTTATDVQLTIGTATDFATLINPAILDARNPRSNASLIVSTGTQVGSPTANLYQAPPASNGVFDLVLTDDQEITLAPGSFLDFANNTVNLTLNIHVSWRERFLEEPERTA